MAFETRCHAEKFLLRKDLLHLSIAMLPNSMAALSRALFAHKKKQFQKGSFPSAIAVNFRKSPPRIAVPAPLCPWDPSSFPATQWPAQLRLPAKKACNTAVHSSSSRPPTAIDIRIEHDPIDQTHCRSSPCAAQRLQTQHGRGARSQAPLRTSRMAPRSHKAYNQRTATHLLRQLLRAGTAARHAP